MHVGYVKGRCVWDEENDEVNKHLTNSNGNPSHQRGAVGRLQYSVYMDSREVVCSRAMSSGAGHILP